MLTSSAIPLLPAAPGTVPAGEAGAGLAAPGLFGALVADGMDGVAAGPDLAAGEPLTAGADAFLEAAVPVAAGAALTPKLADGLALQVQQPVLPGGQVQVQGTIEAVQQLAVQVQVLYQSLVETGTLTVGQFAKGGDLAAALIQQGMAPEEAAAYAERIETMLDVLEAQGLVQDGQAGERTGELAMALLASLLQGAQQPAWQTVQVTTQTEQLVVQVQVQVQQTSLVQGYGAVGGQGRMPGQHPALQGLDLARAVLGHEAPTVAAATQTQPTVLPMEALVQVQTTPASADDMPTATLAAVQLVVGSAQPMQPAYKPAPQAGLGAGVAQPVALEALVQAPSGVEQFRWQREGERDVLKGMPLVDMGKSEPTLPRADATPLALPAPQDAATSLPQPLTAPLAGPTQPIGDAAMVLPTPVADHATLTARLEQAQHARVAQQLTLQFQPLADTGGGKVRMTLNPPELGRIDVELTIRNGEVQGSVAASERAVLEHLVRELPVLRQGLADAGLRVNEQGLSLLLSDGGNGQQAGQQFGQQAGQGGHANGSLWLGGDDVVAADAGVEASRWVAPERLMDVRV
jgi:flagellar hook-length control protein FliK